MLCEKARQTETERALYDDRYRDKISRAVLQNHRSELQYEADEERLLASEPTVQHLTEQMLDATCALPMPTENRSSVVDERPAASNGYATRADRESC